jgi:hypothetical protein
LISPAAPANLLSTNELTAAGVSVKFLRDQAGDRIPCTLTILHREGCKIKFSLTQHNGIWPVPSRRHCNGYAKISGRDMNTLVKAYHTIHGTSHLTNTHFTRACSLKLSYGISDLAMLTSPRLPS